MVTGNDNNIKSGEYLFKGKLAPIDVMNTLVKGNFYYRKITIPECFTVKQVTQLLNDNKYLVGNINKVPEEGSIFPDTYYFQRDEKKIDIIKRMKKKMNILVDEIWNHNNNLFKSKKELVILASLINAETKKNKEKQVVSSVFHNRMIKNMRLQSDPTVLYAKNLYKTNLRAVTNAIGQSWNSDNDSNIGDILIKTANSGSQIHLTTCVKLSCKDPTNVLNDYISFDQ